MLKVLVKKKKTRVCLRLGGEQQYECQSSSEQESIACCHLPAAGISAQYETLWALGSPLWSKSDKPFLVRLVEYRYLWKASVTVPVSIETLGTIAVITMIILTSDATSAGFLFFSLSDVRNYQAFQVGKEKTQPPKSAKIQLSNETKVICSLRPLFTLLLSCSSWSRDYLSLFHRMTASLRNYHECTDARTSFD